VDSFKQVSDNLVLVKKRYGSEMIYQPRKLKSILLDLNPESQRDINILINVISQKEIVKSIQENKNINFDYVVNRIINDTGLSKSVSQQVSLVIFKYFDIEVDISEIKDNENIKLSEDYVKEIDFSNIQNPDAISLIKRAYIFLEDSDWSKADEYFERILDLDPECAEAYLGKLLSVLHVCAIDELKNCPNSFENSNYYKKVLRFGDEKLRTNLKDIIDYINFRNENERKNSIYKNACDILADAKTDEDLDKAIKLFNSIVGYKDTESKIQQCNTSKKELIYLKACSIISTSIHIREIENAISLLKGIIDYKDSREKIDYANERKRKILIRNKQKEEEQRLQEEKLKIEREEKACLRTIAKKKRIKRILIVFIIFIIILIAILVAIKYTANEKINNYFKEQKFSEAYSYYLDNKVLLKKDTFNKIIENCVINNDFETLLNIDYELYRNTKSDEITSIAKDYIVEEQYEDYSKFVANKYKMDLGENWYFEGAIYKQYYLLSILPDDNKYKKEITELYNLLKSYGCDDSNYDSFVNSLSEYPNTFKNDIFEFCNIEPIGDYLVATMDFFSVDGFMPSRWTDSNGHYIETKENDELIFCYNDFEKIVLGSNLDNYYVFYFENGIYSVYERDDENHSNGIEIFKLKLLSKDKIEVYFYHDNNTYELSRR